MPDVEYVEHLYGKFNGRDAVQAWIEKTMNAWPFTHMQIFPWDWYTIDAEQGWVVGQVENRFVDPGDGKVYEGANWTRLVYAGDGLFESEEDVYNPDDFAPAVQAWLDGVGRAPPRSAEDGRGPGRAVVQRRAVRRALERSADRRAKRHWIEIRGPDRGLRAEVRHRVLPVGLAAAAHHEQVARAPARGRGWRPCPARRCAWPTAGGAATGGWRRG